jgi:hypothetical protein
MDLNGVRVSEVVCAENSGYAAVNHQSGCDQEAVLYESSCNTKQKQWGKAKKKEI